MEVVTVFAGDPASQSPAGPWDAQCGFARGGDAAATRRREDEAACATVGARAQWLTFADEQYACPPADAVWAELAPLLAGAAVVLVPGDPLANADHARLTDLVRERARDLPLAFYREQPYASARALRPQLTPVGVLRATGGLAATALHTAAGRPLCPGDGTPLRWRRVPTSAHGRRRKRAALACYRSQHAALGRFVVPQIIAYEWAAGGEAIGWAG